MQQAFNKHEVIAGFAKYPVIVLGNMQTADFELVRLDNQPLSEASRIDYTARSLAYIGTIGILNGHPRTALYEPLDADVIAALAAEYVRLVTAALKPKDDSEDWLRRLWALGSESGQA